MSVRPLDDNAFGVSWSFFSVFIFLLFQTHYSLYPPFSMDVSLYNILYRGCECHSGISIDSCLGELRHESEMIRSYDRTMDLMATGPYEVHYFQPPGVVCTIP